MGKPKLKQSYRKKGRSYYKYGGRYKEVTTEAIGKLPDDSITKEPSFISKNKINASTLTLDRILKKYGLI